MKELKAKDIMNPDVLPIDAEWSVEKLANFLDANSISGGPVVDENRLLVGVVSLTDILRSRRLSSADKGHDFYLDGLSSDYPGEVISAMKLKDASGLKVRDIMTPLVFDVSEETKLGHVADAMIRGHIHRVFVTDEERLLGIITTMDLMKVIRDH